MIWYDSYFRKNHYFSFTIWRGLNRGHSAAVMLGVKHVFVPTTLRDVFGLQF